MNQIRRHSCFLCRPLGTLNELHIKICYGIWGFADGSFFVVKTDGGP